MPKRGEPSRRNLGLNPPPNGIAKEGGAVSGQKPDPTGEKILDGAIRALGDFGLKRATVELVARYAGVSHMTIYRRWPSKNDLLRAAIIGGFTTLLDTAFDHAAESSTSFAEQSLTAFTDLVWAAQNHPLVLRELNAEAGEPSPILPSTSGAVMEVSLPLVAERLERIGMTTDDAPANLDPVADVFVRLAYSLVIAKRPGYPLTTRDEVAEYARECFGPYLRAVTEQADLPEVREGDDVVQAVAVAVSTRAYVPGDGPTDIVQGRVGVSEVHRDVREGRVAPGRGVELEPHVVQAVSVDVSQEHPIHARELSD